MKRMIDYITDEIIVLNNTLEDELKDYGELKEHLNKLDNTHKKIYDCNENINKTMTNYLYSLNNYEYNNTKKILSRIQTLSEELDSLNKELELLNYKNFIEDLSVKKTKILSIKNKIKNLDIANKINKKIKI